MRSLDRVRPAIHPDRIFRHKKKKLIAKTRGVYEGNRDRKLVIDKPRDESSICLLFLSKIAFNDIVQSVFKGLNY